jgi:Holliday junction resolvasome RuvABC endonuclease subunit
MEAVRIVGIDPGATGGICCIDTNNGDYHVADLPLSTDKSLKWIDGLRLTDLLKTYGPNVAVIERCSVFPGQGGVANFHYGMVFGSILSVLQACHVNTEFVTPVVWKKWMGLPGGKDKKASKYAALERARNLFPKADLKRKKDHNRAESLLIATWRARDYYKLSEPSTQ